MIDVQRICERHRALRPADGSGRYSAGQKRCQICEIFINWDELMCVPAVVANSGQSLGTQPTEERL